ncbi:MAG: 54S ribosomal protein L12, mitochondrial [Paramarteilia canceri]
MLVSCLRVLNLSLLARTARFSSTVVAENVNQHQNRVQKLAKEISELSLIDASKLCQELKETLNLPESMFSAPASAQVAVKSISDDQDSSDANTQQSKEQEKLHKVYNVVLQSFEPTSKLKLVRYFKDRMEFSLVNAKNFVESLPKLVLEKASSDDADQLMTVLSEMGAKSEKQEAKN